MSAASFANALKAAAQAASNQHYPQGTLYVVATPIGNLADISLRALHVLQLADVLACEDTRHTQQLLRAYGIDKPSTHWLALHQHNEASASAGVIERLQQGLRVAYISDAGTPGISDPGARLVAQVHRAGLRCIPLPGASSITTLISVAGLVPGADTPADATAETAIGAVDPGFVFAGFLPAKAGERDARVQALQSERRAVVLLEAPHRIEATAEALAVLGSRALTVGRELTKQFETVVTLAADQFAPWLQAEAQRRRGEFALVLHPLALGQADNAAETARAQQVLHLLLAELPLKTAVRLAAEITGQPRNALYAQALEWKQSQPS